MYWKQNTNLSVLSGQITAGWQCVREMWRSCPGLLDGDGGGVGGGGGSGREGGREEEESENQQTQSQVDLWPCAPDDDQQPPLFRLRPVSSGWRQRAASCLFHTLCLYELHPSAFPPPLISPFHTSGRLSAAVRTDLFTLLDTKVGNYDQNSLVWQRKMLWRADPSHRELFAVWRHYCHYTSFFFSFHIQLLSLFHLN